MAVLLKDPAAEVELPLDWSADLEQGAVIVSSEWAVVPSAAGDIVAGDSGFDAAGTTVVLSGGRLGAIYEVRNTILNSNGHTDVRSLTVRVEAR